MPKLAPIRRSAPVLGLLLVLLGAAACGDDNPTGPVGPEGTRPAQLEYFGDPPRVTVPEAVAVGEEFEISIESYGGGCIEFATTGVKRIGDRLEIRPFDDFPAPDAVCTADLRFIDHSITYSVGADLTLEVAIYGVRVSAAGREDMVVTREVVVGGG